MMYRLTLCSIISAISILVTAYSSTEYINAQLNNPIVIEVFAQSTQNESLANNATSGMSNNTEGKFVGAGDGTHNAEGIAKIIPLQDENKVLRLENLKVTNGPDLHVYLATDKSASDFVELGKLKGNIGNQNYQIPAGADLTKYNTVLIWCKTFSVLFGSAKLVGQ